MNITQKSQVRKFHKLSYILCKQNLWNLHFVMNMIENWDEKSIQICHGINDEIPNTGLIVENLTTPKHKEALL